MRFFLLVAAAVFAAAGSPELEQARHQLEEVRRQVADGLLPAAKVAEAQLAVDDALDEEVLDRTLYAHLDVQDLDEQQASAMIDAARRRVERTAAQVAHGRELIAQGVAEPFLFADAESELARRKQILEQAGARASLVREIVEVAKAEVAAEPPPVEWKASEHFEGDGLLQPREIRDITLAFEKQFHEPFPVSARGSTAVHRAMGFDHTGRIDVAIAPDSAEGVWLRKYLETRSIPYYAFRVAIAGKATAPHIHIGPGSTRIATD
jgi:hypothetical protein